MLIEFHCAYTSSEDFVDLESPIRWLSGEAQVSVFLVTWQAMWRLLVGRLPHFEYRG